MKRLSDYTGDEAIEKSGEILAPYFTIISDSDLMSEFDSAENKMSVVGKIMKKYKKKRLRWYLLLMILPLLPQTLFPVSLPCLRI